MMWRGSTRDEATWGSLRDADPDFAEIFKVKATFERDTPLSEESLHHYASFFQKLAKDAKENCPVSKALASVPINLKATLIG